MSLNVAPIAWTSPTPFQDAVASPHGSRPVPPAPEQTRSTAIPPEPPPEVLEMISAAARAYQLLRTRLRELHFEHDPELGRVRIEVCDLDGNVLRTIPPSEVLDIATRGGLA